VLEGSETYGRRLGQNCDPYLWFGTGSRSPSSGDRAHPRSPYRAIGSHHHYLNYTCLRHHILFIRLARTPATTTPGGTRCPATQGAHQLFFLSNEPPGPTYWSFVLRGTVLVLLVAQTHVHLEIVLGLPWTKKKFDRPWPARLIEAPKWLIPWSNCSSSISITVNYHVN
jgi:hypothetical protein